jgi:hypothetical protein
MDDTNSFEVLGTHADTNLRVAIGEVDDHWFVYVWGRGDASWRSVAGPLTHEAAMLEAESYMVIGGAAND